VHELLAFLGVALVVIVTPGQDTALTLRNTMAGGRAAGVRTAAGVVSGQAAWALAAAVGVAALLAASDLAFALVKYAGAAYLVYLGLTSLRSALRGAPAEQAGARTRRPWREGFVSNLGNPKMAAFFTSLLPQFADSFLGFAVLGLAFCAMTMAWLSVVASLAARASALLERGPVRRALDAVTGLALVGLGARLATTDVR
jgi:threonine/homoserine/homoserine lactone efflux protein